MIAWRVLGLWLKKWFLENTFNTDISLILFQQLDLNKHDLWKGWVDFRTKENSRTKKKTWTDFVISLAKMTSTLFDTLWIVKQPGQCNAP
jgi:hypothetical protein